MTDDERKHTGGQHDPADPIAPGFTALGGITGGSVPPAEPISNAENPFSSSGRDTGPSDSRAWLWALSGLALFAILAVTIWLATRSEALEDAGALAEASVSVLVDGATPSLR